jgi:hypothetical protein
MLSGATGNETEIARLRAATLNQQFWGQKFFKYGYIPSVSKETRRTNKKAHTLKRYGLLLTRELTNY